MEENYYHKLGLSPTAGINQVKTAYRNLAKKYHPDVSSEPNAKAKFIEITEAYQYLIDKHTNRGYNRRQKHYNYERQKQAIYEEWIRKKQQEARERARQYAEQSYEEFTNSEVFKQAVVFFSKKALGCLIMTVIIVSLLLLFFWISIGLGVIFLFLSLPAAALLSSIYEHRK